MIMTRTGCVLQVNDIAPIVRQLEFRYFVEEFVLDENLHYFEIIYDLNNVHVFLNSLLSLFIKVPKLVFSFKTWTKEP
jgi:hypothetical protein